ncbi:MAG: AAA family ATPase [Abitibacteriaceae bacterium]|nr:AAA family ATPase [Abditibacteriaceae bacterium]MBV9867561.1 AAA family ATPase [Abditibacteriaceae bacterium]
MANPLRDLFFGTVGAKRELVEAIVPRRTFNDVILPPSTLRALDHALTQIKKHDLIFQRWGLAERHASGLGLAFNFAGPPGTGKTICAEAIANALGKKLLVVRYSEMESLWAGETGKNVSAVFRAAAEQDAVLFFDEADAIAGRRFTAVTQGYQREANTVVNVLLKELEEFAGVVIFATNLAANFDPAFERRVRTHILFEMPGPAERAKIWRVQLHEKKTPLAPDVNFAELGKKYEVSGGDIKNAVLKAAQMATAEPGPDVEKKIHMRHFEFGIQEVLAAKKVMEQSIFAEGDGSHALSALTGMNGAWNRLSEDQDTLEKEVQDLTQRVGEIELHTTALPSIVERFDDAARAAQLQMRAELSQRLDELAGRFDEIGGRLNEVAKGQGELAAQLPQLSAQLPELKEATGKATEQVEAVRGQLTDHHTRLEDLFARQQAERESANTTRQEIEARWKTQWLVSLSIAIAALLASAGGIFMALHR